MKRDTSGGPRPPQAPVEVSSASTATAQPPTPTPSPSLVTVKSKLQAEIGRGHTAVGLAVLDSDGERVLGIESQKRFVLASVAKIYILVAYLDQVSREGDASGPDLDLLAPMIQYSDNDSASELWSQIGKAKGLSRFLASKNLTPITTPDPDEWGSLTASADDVAVLLWRLAHGELLDAASTQLALRLLSNVDEGQSWGVTAGPVVSGSVFYQKNGWYPGDEGWNVNSAAAVKTPATNYVLVVLTYPSRTLETGIGLIESLSGLVNSLMSR